MEEGYYRLKKLIDELEGKRGRHTELVTIYCPAGYSIQDVINQLRQEQGTAENIKSKATRKNVVGALEKLIRHLQLFKKTPENGIAAFAGNVSENEGKTDLQLWSLEPPEPLAVKLYWCHQKFDLSPLKEMIKEKEVFGLIILDKNEADIAVLKGKKIDVVAHLDSIVPGKTRAGGQSAARFGRVREGMLQDFYKKVADVAKSAFADRELKGILVGGPGPIKDDFVSNEYLETSLQKQIIGIRSTGYTGEYGLQELVTRSDDLLKDAAVTREKVLCNDFLALLKKGSTKVSYGVREILKYLDEGIAESVLVSENIAWSEYNYKCSCEKKKSEISRSEKETMCECGKKMSLENKRQLLDVLEEKAQLSGAKIEVISTDTTEGTQIFELGGLAAFLRYEVS